MHTVVLDDASDGDRVLCRGSDKRELCNVGGCAAVSVFVYGNDAQIAGCSCTA